MCGDISRVKWIEEDVHTMEEREDALLIHCGWTVVLGEELLICCAELLLVAQWLWTRRRKEQRNGHEVGGGPDDGMAKSTSRNWIRVNGSRGE